MIKRNSLFIWFSIALLAVLTAFYRPLLAHTPAVISLTRPTAIAALQNIEKTWENQYEEYFGVDLSDATLTAEQIPGILNRLGQETDQKPALIYLIPTPTGLETILVTPGGKISAKQIPEATPERLAQVTQNLRREIANPRNIPENRYQRFSQQLYQWAIAPLEAEWQTETIQTLLLCVGPSLRSVPWAALQDGKQFLIEKYNLALIPAFNMIPKQYQRLHNSRVLAMGASEFPQGLQPLPAVPLEVNTISQQLWPGKSFLNQDLNLEQLRSQLSQQQYQIIHLATHAEFQPGKPGDSYISLWNSQLTLSQMRQLPWDQTELLVLSACKTAIGDREAEMGFAGLAINSGVKSAIASLWQVSDIGTLALMTQFYQHLKQVPIKAEAIRQAQLALLRGQVTITQGQLILTEAQINLTPELAELSGSDFTHPYFWSGFTLIGSPW